MNWAGEGNGKSGGKRERMRENERGEGERRGEKGGKREEHLFFPTTRAFHGDLNEVKKDYPSTFEKPLEVVHKLGFPDVILPGMHAVVG